MGCAWKIEIKQQPSSADSHCLDSAGPAESTAPLTAAQGHARLPGTAQWRYQVCRWMHCWESKHWYSSVEIPGLLMDERLGIQALVLLSGDPRSVDGPATGNPSRQQFLLIPPSQLSLCYHFGDLPRFQINGSQLTLRFASPASHDIPGLILAANPHPQLREVSFLVGL